MQLAIGYGAYSDGGALISVNLAEGVVSLGEKVFAGDAALEKVVLPLSLKSVGYGLFYGASSLRELAYRGTQTDWNRVEKAKGWNYGAGKTNVTTFKAA